MKEEFGVGAAAWAQRGGATMKELWRTCGLPGRHSGGTKLWLIGRHSGGKVENVSEKRARVRPFLWVKLKF